MSEKSASSAARRATTASSAAASIAVVSSPPRPTQDGLALVARRQPLEHRVDVGDAGRQSASQCVTLTGWKSGPDISFGKK